MAPFQHPSFDSKRAKNFRFPFADGTVKLSQFPIAPRGGYFDYEFQLPDDSAGTYIYHAHHRFKQSLPMVPS
ncbi:hypothetical protein H4Q26_012833 [Puccinia striiformis f. sp. tritici PST-130]|nr:hypothetical protein H4Q26_012833 [Puccinia striiformis f. sp. tritici PST-130]